MKINRKNYESVLIDYLEGNLAPLEVAELLLFLEQNPAIKDEFEGISNFNLSADMGQHFPEKEALKKGESRSDFKASHIESLLLGKIENTLSKDEAIALDELVNQNPNIKHELFLFEKTKLKADYTLIYDDKASLKRSSKVIPLFNRIISIAAIFIFLLMLPFMVHYFDSNKSSIEQAKKPALAAVQAPKRVENKMQISESESTILGQRNFKKKQQQKLKISPQESVENNPILVDALDSKGNKNVALVMDSFAVFQNAVKSMPEQLPLIANLVKPETEKEAIRNNPSQFVTLKDLLRNKIKSLGKSENEFSSKEKEHDTKKISGWDIAALCARIINKTSGSKIELKHQYDEAGELKQYAIVSKGFEFSKSK